MITKQNDFITRNQKIISQGIKKPGDQLNKSSSRKMEGK